MGVQAESYRDGALVLSSRNPSASGTPNIADLLDDLAVTDAIVSQHGGVVLATWGRISTPRIGTDPATPATVVLSGPIHGPSGPVQPSSLRLADDRAGPDPLCRLLPPFAAIQVQDGRAYAATDFLGFRHLYYGQSWDWGAVCTSATVLADLLGADLDREGLAVQAMLGWQLGERTLRRGVHKLRQGEHIRLEKGSLTVLRGEDASPSTDRPRLDEAVESASDLLSESLDRCLEDAPDAVLQLTGGLDSRILLAAIPRGRRSKVTALTLQTSPESADVRIAAELAAAYGMPHLVEDMDTLDGWTPGEAHERVVRAAHDLDGMADPFAQAAVVAVEASFPQGRRIAGLGGEVARGFYYVGPPVALPVTPLLTRSLTGWRMFANNSVPASTLDSEFGSWAREFTTREVFTILRDTGLRWPAATDRLYLYERMQRWAGVIDSAVCLGRNTINPMLDPRFLTIADALAPKDKAGARFLAQLVSRLDPELAAIPLEGRLAPAVYAAPDLRQRLANQAPILHKAQRKLVQRVRRDRRPPAGGVPLTALVADHWRQHPELLDPVRASGVVRAEWIDGVLGGAEVDPSSASFVVNLMAVAP